MGSNPVTPTKTMKDEYDFSKGRRLNHVHDWIYIEEQGVYDGALYMECRTCHERKHRFEPGDWQYARAEPYVKGEK